MDQCIQSALHILGPPAADQKSAGIYFLKSTDKWTRAVQIYIVQGSTVDIGCIKSQVILCFQTGSFPSGSVLALLSSQSQTRNQELSSSPPSLPPHLHRHQICPKSPFCPHLPPISSTSGLATVSPSHCSRAIGPQGSLSTGHSCLKSCPLGLVDSRFNSATPAPSLCTGVPRFHDFASLHSPLPPPPPSSSPGHSLVTPQGSTQA